MFAAFALDTNRLKRHGVSFIFTHQVHSSPSAMPVCHCASAGCGALYGRSIDGRTLKNHARADEQRARDLEASQQAANEQEERIASYFASLALSDDSDSYQSQRVSENRMWYEEVPTQSSLDRSTAASGRSIGTTQLTNRERVLRRLGEIDAAVDALRKDVTDLLTSEDNSSKPLMKGLLVRLKQLDDDLHHTVTRDYKNHSITELRQSIGHKLSAVYTSLSAASESRNVAKQRCHDGPVHPQPSHVYHSGSYLSQPCCIYSFLIGRPVFQADITWG